MEKLFAPVLSQREQTLYVRPFLATNLACRVNQVGFDQRRAKLNTFPSLRSAESVELVNPDDLLNVAVCRQKVNVSYSLPSRPLYSRLYMGDSGGDVSDLHSIHHQRRSLIGCWEIRELDLEEGNCVPATGE